MDDSDHLLGRTLGDRWSLRYRLGAGGMGAVYLATDTTGGPAAAVKVVKRELADDAEARARFTREADALKRLDHPCIVRFFDTGETDDLRFIAMELLEGQTLKTRLAARGAMPWRETITILKDVVRALQAAHAAGLIHRDLKPENIFLVDAAHALIEAGAAPVVKLLDFGVARHMQMPAGQTMTATGVVLGTPGFVAPEVVLKGPSNDARSDFYGLGATWFEMLTGKKPFSAETPFALAMMHVSQQAPRPSALWPNLLLPARAEALLMSLLAKTPEARPPNSEVLLDELAVIEAGPDGPLAATEPHSSLHNRFLPLPHDDTPGTRARAGSPADLLPHEATATAGFTAFWVARAHAVRNQRIAAAAGVLVVVIALAVVVVAKLRGGEPGPTVATPAAMAGPPPQPAPPPSVESPFQPRIELGPVPAPPPPVAPRSPFEPRIELGPVPTPPPPAPPQGPPPEKDRKPWLLPI